MTELRPEPPPDGASPLTPFDARHVGLEVDEGLLPRRQAEAVRRVRATARQDLRKLLALDAPARRRRVEEAESRRSFRSRALVEMLLAASRERLEESPEEAESLAEVAGRVLHWTPGPVDQPWRDPVWMRVAAHRADALRRLGRLDRADELFRQAHHRMARGRVDDPAAAAEVADSEAALLWRRGDWAGAARLLKGANRLHRRAGSRPGMVRALQRWAEVLRYGGDPEGAGECLEWALRLLQPASGAGERRGVLLRLGHALCDAGRSDLAHDRLAELRRAAETGEAVPEADLLALAGRVRATPPRDGGDSGSAAAGRQGEDSERAEALLREAHRALVAARRGTDAALVAADLAALLVDGGRAGEAAELLRDPAPGLPLPAGVEESLASWRVAGGPGSVVRALLRERALEEWVV